jgi:hypothetical protein
MTATNIYLSKGMASGLLTDMAICKSVTSRWSFAGLGL